MQNREETEWSNSKINKVCNTRGNAMMWFIQPSFCLLWHWMPCVCVFASISMPWYAMCLCVRVYYTSMPCMYSFMIICVCGLLNASHAHTHTHTSEIIVRQILFSQYSYIVINWRLLDVLIHCYHAVVVLLVYCRCSSVVMITLTFCVCMFVHQFHHFALQVFWFWFLFFALFLRAFA